MTTLKSLSIKKGIEISFMKIKKLFAFVIVVSIIMTTLMTVSSASNQSDFKITNGVLTGYTGTDTDITIPDGVTRIDDYAFYFCSKLKHVNIPDSVTIIGSWAFYSCYGLETLIIPDSVIVVGDFAFDFCSGLSSVTIGKNLTTTSSFMFSNCSRLTDVIIPNTLKGINEATFSGCNSLAGVAIPDSVTSIGDYAFSNCIGLTTIAIPSSITYIGNGLFYNCTRLSVILIPNSVTSIGMETFSGCTSLTNLTIPNSIRDIGNEAFYNCSKLDSIVIPNSMTGIGSNVFYGCSGLSNVTIPNSVTSIDANAFYYCFGLDRVTIPESVASIGANAFYGCTALTGVKFLGNAPKLDDSSFRACALSFKIYYIDGKTGFTNPWHGYATTTDVFIPRVFSDISDHWGKQSINSLTAKGVINGYKVSPGVYEFRPDNPMKREEFAKIITVAYNVFDPTATSSFSDCSAGTWFVPYVGSLENEKLTTGMGDGLFGVGQNMSRQDTATMLAKAMVKYQEITLPDAISTDTIVAGFTDVADMSSYAKAPVAFFVNAEIIKGYTLEAGGFEFRPKANITRAEISKIMIMSLEYVAPTPTPTPTPMPT
jgi:hypothetical protein